MIPTQYFALVSIALALPLHTLPLDVEEIKIGAIMKDESLKESLDRAIAKVNADSSVLFGIKLISVVEFIDSENSYQASKAGECDELMVIVDDGSTK